MRSSCTSPETSFCSARRPRFAIPTTNLKSILIIDTLIMYYAVSPASSIGSSCSATSAMSIDIKSSRSAGRPVSQSCAYPSWPRRSSLSGIAEEATSFISDDDLFPDVFDDESGDCSPVATPHRATSPTVTMRNGEPISSSVLRHLLALQQNQNQQCYLPPTKPKKKRSSRKSRTSSLMSVIAEAPEQGREK